MKLANLLFLIILFYGCSSDEKPIDILLNAPNGALLESTIIGNDNFIIDDLESAFSVQLRASDQERGGFFEFVRVYISMQSNSTNGQNSTQEVILRDIPNSDFFVGEFGFPRINLEVGFQEALEALNLGINDVHLGDQFFIRLDMHLRDGRTIGFANRSPSIIAESCENSPFFYQINVVNPISDVLFTGSYNYEVISSSNIDAVPEFGTTTIFAGEYPNQRRSSFLSFTVAGDFILPNIYQQRGGLCRFGQQIVFWGPQDTSFGQLSLTDDSVFFADFTLGYDGWVGGDLTDAPITVRYRFSKQ